MKLFKENAADFQRDQYVPRKSKEINSQIGPSSTAFSLPMFPSQEAEEVDSDTETQQIDESVVKSKQDDHTPSKKKRKAEEKEPEQESNDASALFNDAQEKLLFNGNPVISDWQGIGIAKHLVRQVKLAHVNSLKMVCFAYFFNNYFTEHCRNKR